MSNSFTFLHATPVDPVPFHSLGYLCKFQFCMTRRPWKRVTHTASHLSNLVEKQILKFPSEIASLRVDLF